MEQDLETVEAPVAAAAATAEPPDTPRFSLGIQRHLILWLEDTAQEIIRATRSWLQYGAVGFAVLCIVIGAVEALFGR